MGKLVDNSVLDGALNIIYNGTTQLVVCADTPTTYANATATYDLATKTGLSTASFTAAADDAVSPYGRKLQVAAQATITVDHSGTATHIALCSGSVLLYVTTCTSQALVAANTVTVPTWKIQIGDPT